MKSPNKPRKDSVFEPVRVGIDCLFFVRTGQPVEPRELVEAICSGAKKCDDRTKRRSRFINRLTPVALMGKATENGVEEVARNVLAKHFQLAGNEGDETSNQQQESGEAYSVRKTRGIWGGGRAPLVVPLESLAFIVCADDVTMSQYAIRPTIRAHNTLKRDDVIKKVASLIAPRHKVNLTTPDKVILIDIFQVRYTMHTLFSATLLLLRTLLDLFATMGG